MLAITYLSSASSPFTKEGLAELLAAVRAKNEQLGITGVLLYSDSNFIQTIEGADDVIEAAFARIGADARHRGVIEVWREQIERRTFPSWSMGFRELNAKEADEIPGFNRYLRDRSQSVGGGEDQNFTPEVFYRIFRDGARGTI